MPLKITGVPDGIRTRVTNVKGWYPKPLDDRDIKTKLVPGVGFEPTTYALSRRHSDQLS